MGERQGSSKARLTGAGICLYACLKSLNASAFVLGELELNSHLGQPLRASIPITAGRDEPLGPECFSLAKPPSRAGPQLSYLTNAVLRLEDVAGRTRLKVSTSSSINEPYVKLVIQAGCGEGSRVREFTALLDPVETSAAPPRIEPGSKSAAKGPEQQTESSTRPGWVVRAGDTLQSLAAGFYPRQPHMQRRMVQALRDANPDLAMAEATSALPEGSPLHVPDLRSLPRSAEESAPAPAKAPKAPGLSQAPAVPAEQPPSGAATTEVGFRLKLSTSDLDLSLLGKLSEEQRQQLREKQLLLDADDQVANTLSMKNRIKQLETQISELRAALGNTNDRLAMSERMAAVPQRKIEASATGVAQGSSGMFDDASLRGMAGAALIVVLMLSVWWRWHRRQAEETLDAELEYDFPPQTISAHTVAAPVMPEAAVAVDAGTELQETNLDEEDEAFHPTSIFDPHSEAVTFTEAESVLDEADLYLAYGWANRAIELLQEYLEHHPEDGQLWKKLLETYSAQGMKQEFEQLAMRCQVTMEDGGLLAMVREMGRRLDPDNPLYRMTPEEQETAQLPQEVPGAATQGEIPTLDMPLEFILDEPAPVVANEPPTSGAAADTLELDPLFPELLPDGAEEAPDFKGPDKA